MVEFNWPNRTRNMFRRLLLLVSSTAAYDGGDAYEVLRSHGLPIGLLPKGVQEFRINGDGRFEVRLPSPCTAKFDGEVLYNATVSGTISPGKIASLSGISAQDLFLWFLVRAIRLDDQASGIIHFDVGVVDKRFALSLFETPPDCSPVSTAFVAESQSAELRNKLDQPDSLETTM
ncbi:uncharacterized protein LOC122015770 [Zingiber officinale]|uniref:uncharacterized protein LOC122015770 n=1 Tax=Zingiber officinale TaxID=94328 RepID=UPI001C4C118B|nr:uncharacterized protein LOC122015770 [Zingiber officinale]